MIGYLELVGGDLVLLRDSNLEQAGFMDFNHRVALIARQNHINGAGIRLEGPDHQCIVHHMRTENIEGRTEVTSNNCVYRTLVERRNIHSALIPFDQRL